MGDSRLAREASPYLLMHADNPVDWYPWGAAAFARATAEDKPILLSVGYAACHWCHVMARESFENEEIAKLMNERFINVKVDREERPDVDATYMQALTRMGQPGGWPLTLFLTPDGKPFWGGTYFPPEPRHGVPAFREVIEGISDLYRRHPGQVSKNAGAAMAALTQAVATAGPGGLTADTATRAVADVLSRVDWDHGGLAGAPKFPHTPLFRFLWRHGLRTGDTRCHDAVRATLDGLRRGGIRDHLGGGFARYAVDSEWRVPHFEKMLSDNALILGLLTDAWKVTAESAYAEAARETAAWALREIITEEGAFATSLAAESKGREGAFYTWVEAEVDALLGPEAMLFKAAYGVTAAGDVDGRCVLHRLAGPVLRDTAEEARLAACRRVLFEARDARVRPVRDDKMLADWNGLMIWALTEAGVALGEPPWLAAAARALDAVTARLDDRGQLGHAWRAGRRTSGLLADHAAMARAALALHSAIGEDYYLALARRWTDAALDRFWDAEGGGFFIAPADAEALPVRLKTADDEATPSANGLMAETLIRLHLLTGGENYRAQAEATVAAFAGPADADLSPLATLLDARAFMARPLQVVVAGDPADPAAVALRDAVFRAPVTDLVFAFAAPDRDLPERHPAVGKGPVGGRPAAYICIGQTCSPPVVAPETVREVLQNIGHRFQAL